MTYRKLGIILIIVAMEKLPHRRFSQTLKTLKRKKSSSFTNPVKKQQQIVKVNNVYFKYFGDKNISLAKSFDLQEWRTLKKSILESRIGYFDAKSLHALASILTKDGILVIYYVKNPFILAAALFYKDDPTKLLWRSERYVFTAQEPVDVKDFSVGKDSLILRLILRSGNIKRIKLKVSEILGEAYYALVKHYSQILKRTDKNPIITPRGDRFWESQATFNAAATYEKGKIHLLYRAIGETNTSVLGYAASSDGVNIDERGDTPAYVPYDEFEKTVDSSLYSPYMSGGGGFGGCEDPRITKIGDRLYLTYVAYNGWDHPRIALTSISGEDFAKKNWNAWEKPVLISPPGVVDKNGCILPEKINGKFVIFHRIFPNILIDFVDDLKFGNGKYLRGEFSIKPRDASWDSRKIGAGPPPIKTKDGWLMVYHAVDDREPSKYKIGAMLLDIKDPTKVLYRPKNPILEPTSRYENEGYKAGVVYPCGAVVKDEELFVYYGGADSVLCLAKANLADLLDHMKYV